MTSNRVLTALLALLVFASLISLGIAIAAQNLIDIAINAGGFIAVLVLLIAHQRGWRWSAQATVILTTLIIVASVPSDPRVQQLYLINALIPAILALVLLPWYWSFGSFLVSLVGIIAQADLNQVLADPVLLVILLVMAGGGALAAVVSQTAQHHAEANARRAEEALAHVERQAAELTEANELMSEQLDQQGKLLELVSTLETPVVPLADGIILAPIVGHMDVRRADELTSRLLRQASTQRARLVVLDIAGVAVMDTTVAKSLLHTIHALRLLGCEVTLSGISASVAMSLIHLGVDLDEVKTVRSPQEALMQYGIWTGNTASVSQHTAYLYGAN